MFLNQTALTFDLYFQLLCNLNYSVTDLIRNHEFQKGVRIQDIKSCETIVIANDITT